MDTIKYYKNNNNKVTFERVEKVLRGEIPDRVPYIDYWYVNQQAIEHVLNRKLPPLGWFDDAISAPDDFEFAERIGMDAVTCDYIYRPNHIPGESETGDTFYAGGTIDSREDFEERIDPPPASESIEKKVKSYAEKRRNSNIGVIHTFTGILDPAYLSMGMGKFMLKLYDEHDLVVDMLDYFLKHTKQAIEIVCEYPEVDMVCINDDVCIGTGTIISLDMMKELWKPRVEELIKVPKEKGKILAYHSDGKVEPLIPWLLEMGFSAIHPVEPYANDIYRLKKKWGSKITLMGNIDITLLTFGKSGEVRKDVNEHIKQLGPTRYIVSSSNSIVQKIPPENFLAMTSAVVDYPL